MATHERSGITSIPFESGVTVDIEDKGNRVSGVVWTITDTKIEFSDIDLAISIGFPDTYVSWLKNTKTYFDSNRLNEPVRRIDKIIESCTNGTQDLVDEIAKICRDSCELE